MAVSTLSALAGNVAVPFTATKAGFPVTALGVANLMMTFFYVNPTTSGSWGPSLTTTLATATTGDACDINTAGAMPMPLDALPSSTDLLFKSLSVDLNFTGNAAKAILMVDRLWHYASGATVPSGAFPLASPLTIPTADQAGAVLVLQPLANLGATSLTFTAQIVFDDSTTENVTCVVAANAGSLGRVFPFIPTTLGKRGIKQINSLSCSATSTGYVAIAVVRPILTLCGMEYQPIQSFDGISLGLGRFRRDACIEALVINQSAVSLYINITGSILAAD